MYSLTRIFRQTTDGYMYIYLFSFSTLVCVYGFIFYYKLSNNTQDWIVDHFFSETCMTDAQEEKNCVIH